MLRRFVPTDDPYSMGTTLGPLSHGPAACARIGEREAWLAFRVGERAATLRFERAGAGVEVQAWGDAAEDSIETAPALLGADDDPASYRPVHPVLRDLHRRFPGVRMTRSGRIFDALVPAILEQKVTGGEAARSWANLVRRYGDPAPGPGGLMLAPSPERIAAMPYYAFHPLGVERLRTDTIRRACARAGRLNEAATMDAEAARRRLRALPGIGVWTAAEVTRVTHGDADCVSVGDFHIKNMVSWALAGEPRGSDERMMELLEPEAGHRGRAVRLLELAGIAAPKFGPRHERRNIARI